MFSLKFGGTSMGNSEAISQTAQIIISHPEPNKVVTVSAMSGVTNLLISAANCATETNKICYKNYLQEIQDKHLTALKKLVNNTDLYRTGEEFITKKISGLSGFLHALTIIGEVSPRSNDEIVSLGEILSAKLLSLHLQDLGEKSDFINLENIVSKMFDKDHTEANKEFFECFAHKLEKLLTPLLEKNITPICTGFFGKIPGGIVATVGRGYSDFTAALIGKACNAKEIQIWTDVNGILSTDPRIVPEAHVIEELSFDEATELANLGAKVIHPQTIWPAVKNNILVRIKNTMSPLDAGTAITKEGKLSTHSFKSITIQKDITIITVRSTTMTESGVLGELFQEFANHKVSIDLVSTSESSISVTIQNENENKNLQQLITQLEKKFIVNRENNNTIIAIIGNEMRENIGVAGRFLSALSDHKINVRMISQGANQSNISAVISQKDSKNAVQAVHKKFFRI
ncbi:TPA: aspartate kinase [Candidatus Gracilibacteria bacterium]|nr:aspartate kinase [Candidatus Peregrinibacteria bacterium]HIQ56658.1 aspartate kinase [Candidatus Gracilibacteria bacterium]